MGFRRLFGFGGTGVGGALARAQGLRGTSPQRTLSTRPQMQVPSSLQERTLSTRPQMQVPTAGQERVLSTRPQMQIPSSLQPGGPPAPQSPLLQGIQQIIQPEEDPYEAWKVGGRQGERPVGY